MKKFLRTVLLILLILALMFVSGAGVYLIMSGVVVIDPSKLTPTEATEPVVLAVTEDTLPPETRAVTETVFTESTVPSETEAVTEPTEATVPDNTIPAETAAETTAETEPTVETVEAEVTASAQTQPETENTEAAAAIAEPAETTAVTFIGNKNSLKLHSQDCANLPKEENRTYFDSYQEAIDAGYTPCGSCLG